MRFANPLWFIALALIPALVAAAVLCVRLRGRQWEAFTAERLRHFLIRGSGGMPRWIPFALTLTAIACTIIGLARPQGGARATTHKQVGHNVILALDISRSMRVADVTPDRLSQAKIILLELLEALPQDRIGLVAFAGSADDYAPLTVDHSALRETIEQLDETWAPVGGSNIVQAVRTGIESLASTGQSQNALILVSDGEKHDGDISPVIDEAKRAGVRIITIGVGTQDGGFVPSPDTPGGRLRDRGGRNVISRLQPDLLRELADKTGGRHAIAGGGADIPAMVKSVVNDLDAFEAAGLDTEVRVEFFQWLVLPAVLLAMAAFFVGTRWRRKSAATLAAFWLATVLHPSPASADELGDAAKALTEREFDTAAKAFRRLAETAGTQEKRARFQLAESSANYGTHEFSSSRAAASAALLSEDPSVRAAAHHATANALFQLGWTSLTDAPYPTDVRKLPPMALFEAAVQKHLADIVKADPLDNEKDSGKQAASPAQFEQLITNWTDAIRHYRSAVADGKPTPGSQANLDLTTRYLRRLQELLEENQKQTQSQLPQQPQAGQGEGDPQDQDGPEGDPKSKDKGNGNDKDKGKPSDDKEQDGDSGDKNRDAQGERPAPDEKLSEDGSKQGESPQDRARRLLKQSADLEKGPVGRGQFNFDGPDKDW